MSNLVPYLKTITESRRMTASGHPHGHFVGMEDFVLDQGCDFVSSSLTSVERDILLEAVRNAGGIRQVSEIKQCFANAQRLLLADATGTLSYAEGYAVGVAHFPVHHGWVVLNKKLVDMTWRHPKPRREKLASHIVGLIPEDWEYRGVLFSQQEVRENVVRSGFYQTLIDDWQGGHPLFHRPRNSP